MKNNIITSAIYRTIFTLLLIIAISGNILSQTNSENKISNTPINKLTVKGNITVYIMQDAEQSIYFQGDKNAVKQIKTSITDNTLNIFKGSAVNDERVIVFLTIKNLESIKTYGEVVIETPSNINISKLSVNLSEETETMFFINSKQLDLNVSGKGDFYISGNIDTLNIAGTEDAIITGNIKSNKLSCRITENCNITLSGTVYKSILSAFNQGFIDITDCKNIISSVVAFDYSKVKINSKYIIDIYAFDNSSVNYRKSNNKSFILENSENAQVIQETSSTIAKN